MEKDFLNGNGEIVSFLVLVLGIIGAIIIVRGIVRYARKVKAQAMAREQEALQATRRKEEHEREVRKTRARQETLGGRFFNELIRAAGRNKISNIMPSGRIAPGISPIMVGRIPNQGTYDFLVYMLDKGNAQGSVHILQVCVNLFAEDPTQCIRVVHNPHGPKKYFSEEHFDYAVQAYAQWVEHYSLFSKTQEKHLQETGLHLVIAEY